MKQQTIMQKFMHVVLAVMLLVTAPLVWAAGPGSGWGGGWDDSGGDTTTPTQVFDTSFAVEYSYSCLEGGCHENNQNLVDEYSESVMTHAMVKCNVCHGTHTADEVGTEKPNLTGYTPGIGPTGYSVGKDRCKTCHNKVHTSGRKASSDCTSCHSPHVFRAQGNW